MLTIRLKYHNVTAMGPGKADLLEAIEACGSISSAAKQMKMSYRRAWELVDVMNQSFNEPLVMGAVGGAHGGGAKVTDLGRQVLQSYRALVANAAASDAFAEIAAHIKTTS
jgi:molybdate transport system regulatory protein